MSEFNNTNSGALFKNDRKATPQQPDYKGNVCIACPHCSALSEHWISAWIKPMKNKAGKWMSMAYQAKDDQPNTQAQAKAQNGSIDFDDDIPF